MKKGTKKASAAKKAKGNPAYCICVRQIKAGTDCLLGDD